MSEQIKGAFIDPYKTGMVDERNGETVEVTVKGCLAVGTVISNLINVLVVDIAGDRCVVLKENMSVVESIGGNKNDL